MLFLLAFGGFQHPWCFLTCSFITSVLASVVMWDGFLSSVCLCTHMVFTLCMSVSVCFSSSKGTGHIGLRAHLTLV